MKKLFLVLALVAALSSAAFAAAETAVEQENYPQLAAQAALRSQKLREAAPEMMDAFKGLAAATLRKDGPLSMKTKELIALMLGLQSHCQTCINSHVQGAIKAGVTREELVDALGVAVLMGGGPSSAYAAIVLEAYDQFSAKMNAK